MGGPSVSRQNINTAPIQGLSSPLESLLKNFLQSKQNPFASATQPSDLQRQTAGAYSSLINQGNMGQGVINAAQPIFEQNLQRGADILRQSGPRFASNTERLVGEQTQHALNDFNLFQANALQQGQQQQLANLVGAGDFGNTMQGQALGFDAQMLSQLLGLAGTGGMGPAALIQHQGTFQDIMQGVGGAASLIAAARGGSPGNVGQPRYGTTPGFFPTGIWGANG